MSSSYQFGADIMARIEQLAEISESPDGLTRRYLTPEHRRANNLVAAWMRDAGMAVREDAIGNVIGRYEGERDGLPAVMVGSHLDTVVMAGRYDGMLGVLSGIECARALKEEGTRLPYALEVIGFADEEGARFQSTYLGSRAVAGTFETHVLGHCDQDGISMADAMRTFGLDPDRISDAARRPDDILAYLEVHIEQGPVLEKENLAVGAVTAISGANRLRVQVSGTPGHAGTVPMVLRNDALVAASECVLAVSQLANGSPQTVGTVGQLAVEGGGASNVIPGSVSFSVDLRAADDGVRRGVVETFEKTVQKIAEKRSVEINIEKVHEADSVECASWIIEQIDEAATSGGGQAFHLPSGAGHDAAAMADITDVGMIFVRCLGGISHAPAESITEEDAIAGARLLFDVVRNFKLKPETQQSQMEYAHGTR